MSNKPLISKYQRDPGLLSGEQRRAKLIRLMSASGLTSVDIASAINRRAQTVRCWVSAENKRNIPLDALNEVYIAFGYSVDEDFPIA
ncbi:hypothetical protein [Serratia phage vB_SmaS_Opt-169]|uniref:Uncharacterized protein n=1 Tax=Serratia phage vB_SmaS_Rovert TaxID=2777363 RepID=A0A7T3N9U4_9CAUD|nr:hypothetical protein QJS24_gp51 [Serratia phage vB_SmaS_Rovert]QPX75018.1 hypothetical protein [Serratia phage vB_SmaS_Rovert]QPX75464.1 hypothetical protein [Serratia phage vB_SmaS_Opt-169]UGO51935.1 hypothetical protein PHOOPHIGHTERS_1 [Serratia phage vB_SmaS_PhooPhighters]